MTQRVTISREREPWLWSLVDHASQSAAAVPPTELRLSLNGLIDADRGVLTIGLPMLVLPAEELCSLIAFALVHHGAGGHAAYWLSRGERAAVGAAAAAANAEVAASAFRRAALAVVAWPVFSQRWLVARSWSHCPVDVMAGFCAMLEANHESLATAQEAEMDRPTWLGRSWQRRIHALHANPGRESGVRDQRPTFRTINELSFWEDSLLEVSSHPRASWEDVVSHGWPNLYLAACDDWTELLVISGALSEVTLASALHRFAAPDWETVACRISRLARPVLGGDPRSQTQHISRDLVAGALLGQGLARMRLNWCGDNDLLEGFGSCAWSVPDLVAEVPGSPKAVRALLRQLGERGVDVHLAPGAELPVRMVSPGR